MGKSLGLLAAALLTGAPGAASAQDEFEFTGKWTVAYHVYPKEHDGLRQARLFQRILVPILGGIRWDRRGPRRDGRGGPVI